LEFNFSWTRLSAIAGLTPRQFYFQLHRGAIRAEEVVGFLRHLRRHLRGRKLLLLWDRAPIHRSRRVRDYLATLGGQMEVAYLPAYAPELNPVEYLWGYWKRTELANFCPKDIWELRHFASQALRRIRRRRRRPALIASFFRQAELF
jgi:transposase